MANGWNREWRWTEKAEFSSDCEKLATDPGDVDFIRWLIHDWILPDPYGRSIPLYSPDEPWFDPNIRSFRINEAEGLSHLGPSLVVFRIESELAADGCGELTGLLIRDDPAA